ncbi:hypothetical protein [Streptomyces sp. NPDC006668]|uniref:hypothetical protein n=1 Tax=Streptomyces sp. NPDC006668 TaxID=3156903 RepID=UPI0033CDD4C2
MQGIDVTPARLVRYGDPAGLPVDIATIRGLVVDRLLAASHPVVPTHAVIFRYATSRPARVAITAFADNSRHGADWAAKICTAAQARKKRHAQAVRILARAWLRVMWSCWRDGACHTPAVHQANNKVKPVTETPLAAQRSTQETHACAMGPERLTHCCFVLEPSNRVLVSR